VNHTVLLTTKNNETKHYICQKYKRQTEKPAVANKTNQALVWYDFYDLWLGNGVGPILETPQLARGKSFIEHPQPMKKISR